MNNELIPSDDASDIVRQVFAAIQATLANDVAFKKSQLLQMINQQVNEAVDEYLDALNKKLDE